MADERVQLEYQHTYSIVGREIDKIVNQLPLINVPIKAPKLLPKLAFEEIDSIDSFALFRNYLTVLKALKQRELLKGKRETCLNWFKKEIEKQTLEFAELKKFIDNSRWKTKDTMHLEYLINCFKQKKLTPKIFEEKTKELGSIDTYDSPWSRDKVFVEDVTKELNNSTATFGNYLEQNIKKLTAETSQNKYYGLCCIIYEGTIYLLNLYEKAIINIIFKQRYTEEFEVLLTRKEPYDVGHFSEEILNAVDAERSKLADGWRSENDVIEIKLDIVEHEIRGMPTVDDLNAYIANFEWEVV